MTRRPGQDSSPQTREARLKAALRANLARRKAQGRARAQEAQDDMGQGASPQGVSAPQDAPGNED
ncbi:hypothetical protein [Paracoccus sp. SMMA_5]|uniref:hypothetical protein n=1 Tax=Paracoccus sp. SMMA_5 TaxID=2654281 RepID=UPI0012B1DCA8|nr:MULTISPECIES: hypothetical protein [unclassified Paracoccus (in: a-proteobacteria)]UXU73929.1 hypothetical protein GB879_008315 [Paracoccus sp. SMMA_5]UXU79816.1 hypothetical protein GB880_008295 [Paracoccus sp. SMMA_5_TC]